MALTKPTQITVPFASSGLKNTIPETATGSNRASMQEGFPAITMQDVDQGGMAPYGQDMNGILYDVTEAIRYQQAGGLFPYDATFAASIDGYPIGAILTSTDGRKLFQNTMNGNQSNPENGGANWTEITDIQITATGSTYPRKLSDRFADVVNVLDYGAKGDGTTDDTLSIQSAIDSNYNRTIFFPDGVYLVSDTIVTDCEVAKRQSILLSSGARIKASLTFSGDYVVNLGGRGTAPAYNLSDVPVGIYGGMIDCNSVASGLESVKTHCARIQNLNVWNVKDVGVYVGDSNNASADAYVQNLSVGGNNREGSVGIWIDAYDCDVRDVRVRGCQTGIKMLKGGYIANAHPIVGSNNSQSFWESSVGFDINGANLVSCYADNFGTGFKVGNADWTGSQLVALWYENNSYSRTAFSGQSYWRGSVDASVVFPENGTNKLLTIDSFNVGNFPYSWSDTRKSEISFKAGESEWSRLTDRFSDTGLLLQLSGKDRVYSGNTGTVWENNKWYPLVISQGIDSANDLNCYIGEDLNFRISYKNSTSLFNPDVSIINNPNNVSLSFCQTYRQSIAGVNCYILWFKITSSDSITGIITVSPVTPALRSQIFTHARAVHNFEPRSGNVYDIPFSGVSTPTGTAISGIYSLSGTVPAVENIVETSFSTSKSAIKYSSGYMVAWGKVSYNSTNVSVTFPFEFFEAPSVSLGANVLTNLRYTGLSTTVMNLQASTAATITWQANGRWK